MSARGKKVYDVEIREVPEEDSFLSCALPSSQKQVMPISEHEASFLHESSKTSQGLVRKEENEISDAGTVLKPPLNITDEITGGGTSDQQPIFPDIVLREEIPDRKTHTSRKWLRRGVSVGLICIGVVIVMISTVLASITVKVKPKMENIVLENTAVALDTAETAVHVPRKVIPAERLEFTRTMGKEFPATGSADFEERARGSIKIYNNFSSSAQRLVEGTRFVTDSGMLYRLIKTVVVPGAQIDQGKIVSQFVEAELQADGYGEESNTAAKEIQLRIPGFQGTPKYDGFYAIASEGFSGGYRGVAKVVTRDDLIRAQEQATKEIFDTMRREISQKIPSGFTFAEGLREIQIIEMRAPAEKTRGAAFTVEVHARGRVMVFREKDVFDFLERSILQGDTTKTFVADSLNVQYQARNFDLEKGIAELIIKGDVAVKHVIVKEDVLNILRGKEEEAMVNALRKRSDVVSFSVAFFPPWIARAPDNIAKIRLVIEGEPE